MKPSHKLRAVTICPGPNLAYFKGTFTLKQMVDHIYGRKNLLKNVERPFCLVNELQLYFDYFRKQVKENVANMSEKSKEYFVSFKNNLLAGIDYYENLLPAILPGTNYLQSNLQQLKTIRTSLNEVCLVTA